MKENILRKSAHISKKFNDVCEVLYLHCPLTVQTPVPICGTYNLGGMIIYFQFSTSHEDLLARVNIIVLVECMRIWKLTEVVHMTYLRPNYWYGRLFPSTSNPNILNVRLNSHLLGKLVPRPQSLLQDSGQEQVTFLIIKKGGEGRYSVDLGKRRLNLN